MTKPEATPLSKNMRWLVGATGLVTGAIFMMDYGVGLLGIFLIVGALTAGSFPRVGKALTWFGAIVVDFFFQVGERKFRVRPGGSVFGPPGVPHAFRCVGKTQGKMIIACDPPRR